MSVSNSSRQAHGRRFARHRPPQTKLLIIPNAKNGLDPKSWAEVMMPMLEFIQQNTKPLNRRSRPHRPNTPGAIINL